ncbi:Unknown protein [Striga hermonthica]|uniref:Uncharacterized protein n=1 Tax=Striga hermonthica TaxID=68872 RepID=A0A9N7MF06_STRHE|nr:Unknown protein [Striga hermonthica]
MQPQNLCLHRTLNPNLFHFPANLSHPLIKHSPHFHRSSAVPKRLIIRSQHPSPIFPHRRNDHRRPDVRSFAGRSKGKPGGESSGRIEGGADIRREAKRNARRRSRKLAENEKKSKCLEFLFTNHPVMLLHPYTKEWKLKLEEMELGCDAPDEFEFEDGEKEILDWVEDDSNNDDNNDDEYDEDDDDDDNGVPDDVIDDVKGEGDELLGIREDEDESGPEQNAEYWDEEFKKAMRSNEGMEKLVERSIETANKFYEGQMGLNEEESNKGRDLKGDGDELEMRGKRAKVSREEWKLLGYGPYRRKVRKSKMPPGLFLKAAVRPFTYRNLVKEIVLTRHAIVEGEIGMKKKK